MPPQPVSDGSWWACWLAMNPVRRSTDASASRLTPSSWGSQSGHAEAASRLLAPVWGGRCRRHGRGGHEGHRTLRCRGRPPGPRDAATLPCSAKIRGEACRAANPGQGRACLAPFRAEVAVGGRVAPCALCWASFAARPDGVCRACQSARSRSRRTPFLMPSSLAADLNDCLTLSVTLKRSSSDRSAFVSAGCVRGFSATWRPDLAAAAALPAALAPPPAVAVLLVCFPIKDTLSVQATTPKLDSAVNDAIARR